MNKGKTPGEEEEEETSLSRRGYEAYRPGRKGASMWSSTDSKGQDEGGLVHNFNPRCHIDPRLKDGRALAFTGAYHSCPSVARTAHTERS